MSPVAMASKTSLGGAVCHARARTMTSKPSTLTLRPQHHFARQMASFVVLAKPNTDRIDIEKAVQEATEVCEDGNAQECATAWDTVEELSAEKSHKKQKDVADPLEEYCKDEPSADECRVYEE